MPDPQPSAAAKRLARIADMAIHGTPHATREKRIALALDDAGVGKAVAILEVLKQETGIASWLRGKDTSAVAALTGDDDAK